MLSFAMFINFNKIQLLKTVFLVPFLMLCLNAQATNFYVGAAYTPLYFSSWSWNGGANSSTFETWYPLALQVHVGVEQKLLHLEEEDPAWGHADFGVAARFIANLTLTDDRHGGSNISYGLEPYLYFTPSSQLGLKLYVGSGITPDELTDSIGSFFAGLAIPLDESIELFMDYRTKQEDGIADYIANSTSYNIGVNFKF